MNSESFNFKINITGKTPDAGNTKNVKIAVSLKYLINFRRTLILTWSKGCVVSSATEGTKLAITDIKHYITTVT